MATRSNIGIENQNGTIVSIYCHWDGYLDGVGQTLKEFYTEPNKVQQLIDLGDISYLEENVSPDSDNEHSFDKPKKGVTVAYHRDRGEDYNQRISVSRQEYLNGSESYTYLFSNNQWLVYDDSADDFIEY